MLSLFFIESVARYRQYDKDGNPVKGDYARIFEEEYRRAAKLPAYQSLFTEIDLASAAEDVHNGYFSVDKKKIGGKSLDLVVKNCRCSSSQSFLNIYTMRTCLVTRVLLT